MNRCNRCYFDDYIRHPKCSGCDGYRNFMPKAPPREVPARTAREKPESEEGTHGNLQRVRPPY